MGCNKHDQKRNAQVDTIHNVKKIKIKNKNKRQNTDSIVQAFDFCYSQCNILRSDFPLCKKKKLKKKKRKKSQ